MAVQYWGIDQTYIAAIDLSASQYHFVKAGSVSGEVTLHNVAGGSPLGVLQNDPKASEMATVRVFGFTKVKVNCEAAASPLVFGNFVKAASDGRVCGALNPAASVTQVGIAQESVSSGCGMLASIWLTGPHRWAA